MLLDEQLRDGHRDTVGSRELEKKEVTMATVRSASLEASAVAPTSSFWCPLQRPLVSQKSKVKSGLGRHLTFDFAF
jgi:hypothetical protein